MMNGVILENLGAWRPFCSQSSVCWFGRIRFGIASAGDSGWQFDG